MNRMVERIGIAKGSLFQYFGSKEGLFHVIFDYAVDLVRQSLRQVKRETSSADFFERIKESTLAGIGFIERHPKVYRIYLKMIFQEEFPLRAEFLEQVHLFSAEYLRPIVEAGIAGETSGRTRISTWPSSCSMRCWTGSCKLTAFPFSMRARAYTRRRGPELERKVDEFITLLKSDGRLIRR